MSQPSGNHVMRFGFLSHIGQAVFWTGWGFLLWGIGLLAMTSQINADDLPADRPPAEVASLEGLKYFETHVRPLLIERCYKCHGTEKQSGDLRLDSLSALHQGGESGPAIDLKTPEESLLLQAVNYTSFEMPPDGKLTDEQIGHLTQWVRMGAPWPAGEAQTAAVPASREFTEADRNYWAFQPVVRPTPPTRSANDSWSRTAIDQFILQSLQASQLQPAQEADRLTLIRRVCLDLTGLPPTPEQYDAFISDSSPTAYEQLVEQLLASPRYGEHMAHFWLDLVRYAESDGYKQDTYRPTAWRYRDYVVQSFNSDKGYDQFVKEQLAGDEIEPGNPDALAATGYLRNGIYEYNQRDAHGQWRTILEDMTETTSDAFLGLGLACAKCHDHKFDPLLQKDYYRLQAFLCNVSFQDQQPLVNVVDVNAYQTQLAHWEEKTRAVRQRLAELEQPRLQNITDHAVGMFHEDFQAMYRKPAAERTPYEQQIAHLVHLQVLEEYPQLDKKFEKGSADRTEWETLKRELSAFDSLKPEPLPTTLTVSDVGPVTPVVKIPDRARLGEILPGVPSVLDPEPMVIPPVPGSLPSSGRRSALARWIASPDNPLSTRVIVNRLWQQHFGIGLVASSSDFGRLGELPSHPELLDWLAAELVANQWSLKSIHRQIVLSATYRQLSLLGTDQIAADRLASGLSIDPANRLLWHYPLRRLDAEQIRDSMLAASGELDLTSGGPGSELTSARRSVYLKSMRNTREPLLQAFDQPDRIAGTGCRNVTTSPTQSLLMVNGDWTLKRATELAARVEREIVGADDSRIRYAYRLALIREPSEVEFAHAREFLDRSRANVRPTSGEQAPVSTIDPALADFCHVLLNSNEFLYVD